MATTYEWEQVGGEIMDSRSLIAVAEDIRDALAALAGENTLGGERDESPLEELGLGNVNPEDDEERARELLAEIDALAESGIEDWQYGAALIRGAEYWVRA